MSDSLASSGLVVVDKPQGMTSHDVVGRIRRIMGTKKVGHAGTLDPMATGVLVLGVNRGTKFLAHLVAETKSYAATMRLGAATDTDDAEGTVLHSAGAADLTEDDVREILPDFTGDIMQRPTQVSAIKIDGKRAYQRARDGEDFEIPARPVNVSRFEILTSRRDGEFLDVDVEVDCSSGTYIRALARDIGAGLGCGGHLTALRRTALGPISVNDALSLEELEESPRLSLTMDQALPRFYPTLPITASEAEALSMGKWLDPKGISGVHAAIAPDGRAIALVKENSKRLSTIFVARPSTL
ncbi:tRNA pseudouridine synthase B [Corynebacterium renale]|uniref:tRNA pseudouridine(55) synthase TruB n=1 Tax=Corynebacterium renale TaxID=1724 RepID=UPI000DA27EA2|nr:tRNA pseudouridine(55) synthase TruB [Corynebacterium renale]SQG64879.1 tRNA pseudouridine synthase B [Corynebacterium renale]STC96527.1 tRNA pseudouridine synthase B [Corynebacterium renale]